MPEDAYLPLSRLTETACRLAEMGKDSRLTPSAAQREDAVLLRRTAETVYDHGRDRLQHAFITPIEREDLLLLTQRMLRLAVWNGSSSRFAIQYRQNSAPVYPLRPGICRPAAWHCGR